MPGRRRIPDRAPSTNRVDDHCSANALRDAITVAESRTINPTAQINHSSRAMCGPVTKPPEPFAGHVNATALTVNGRLIRATVSVVANPSDITNPWSGGL